MTEVYALAALWVGLALLVTLLSIWLRIATAMSEIVVGTVAQLVIGAISASACSARPRWAPIKAGSSSCPASEPWC